MKSIAIGAHLRREDIEPLAEAHEAGEVFLSAIGVADDQPLSDRDLLVRVSAVRAALLERATFVAIRYGFTFRSAADAASKCASQSAAWRTLLTEHRARVEFSLKVTAPGKARPHRRDFQSGAAYMRALHDARDSVAIPDDFRQAVERIIIPVAVRHRWVNRDSTTVELAGLIERESLSRLAEAGQALKESVSTVPFLLSAPWPLEVFAEP
ncbi:MAG TPA: GvpL/GvpF family gas vesicle protein [Thermoanaerobaculia bacterium]|nr:GvpL/GvpF family gas vesicle protein [Thermoanaerobaculia bacterium]